MQAEGKVDPFVELVLWDPTREQKAVLIITHSCMMRRNELRILVAFTNTQAEVDPFVELVLRDPTREEQEDQRQLSTCISNSLNSVK